MTGAKQVSTPADGSQTAQLPVADGGHSRFIADVDQHMFNLIDQFTGVVADAARGSVAAGGKRLRPLLTWVGSPTSMRDQTDVRRALVLCASAIELIHTASLVHDDLLDGADLRRGRPTVASIGGDALAIPTGDLLFSQAFAALTECEPLVGTDITRVCVSWLAETARELAEGEALQARQTSNYGLGVDEYLHRCRLKTGTLFGTAMRIGALVGGASHAEAELLRIFGTDVGVAFQIVDDTLDVTGSAPKLGKEPGADLRDGTVTLPTLLAIHERPEIAASIRALDDGDAVEHVLAQIRATRGPETAGQRAQALALAAWQRISGLDPDRWNMLELRRVHDAAVQRLT